MAPLSVDLNRICKSVGHRRITVRVGFPRIAFLFAWTVSLALPLAAQSPNGTINGQVLDPSNRVIGGADVLVVNDVTGVKVSTQTNEEGIYVLPNLPPGPYRLQVSKPGFKTLIKPDIILNVQDALSINFTLPVGAAFETMTVEGGAPLVNTESASVSTVVDRQFAENLPMNGRSFQTLIELTPGVVATTSTPVDGGQFSVNGQRGSSNYWMVDGVSANIGVSATNALGNGLGGGLGSFSALGGTNSLVSIDAMQEFRIQTSTYAPEFGRTPGAQISIVTRSGTNQFHGTAFDYLRNNLFDANDWFADYAGLAKPEERQNDFGGTFSGPILKDRTFFFLSYEGLRLRLPQVVLDTVPDTSFTPGGTTNSRQSAIPSLQPYFNAFPLPNRNSPEIFTPCDPATDPTCPPSGQKPTGTAQFNASFSNAATLDAYSIRIDHKLSNKWGLFGRYNYSPSQITGRGSSAEALSVVDPIRITTQTATVGASWIISPVVANDIRFNYSRTNGSSTNYLSNFGGAVPLTSLPFPTPFTTQNSLFGVGFFALKGGPQLVVGRDQQTLQRQFNIVDGLSLQQGRHSLKFGVDFRRLSPVADPSLYTQSAIFIDMPSAETGIPLFSEIQSSVASTFLFRNLGVYAQDTCRVASRLTLTYGLRWDVDFAPVSLSGPNMPAVTGYSVNNLSNLALASSGTAPFNTTFRNLAPRIGVAYELSQASGWQTVLRGGFGVFYDLVTSAVGPMVSGVYYPFGAHNLNFGGTFPLDPASAAPPTISPDSLSCCGNALVAFDPHLKLPYTLQWNVALEQGLGSQQSVSASYIGSSGRRLLQTADIFSPNPSLSAADLVSNTAASDYNALQLQFQRRLSHGLQALVSYTWSHSIDDGSAGSDFVGSNTYISALGANANRGPSDFDIRDAFSAGVTYDIPVPKINASAKAVLRGWSIQTFVVARSSPPVDVYYDASEIGTLFNSGAYVRPDVVPGQPLYLNRSQCVAILGPPCAGGKGFNPAAFTPPPLDPSTGNPLRQGNLGRNTLRGFAAAQADLAVHREFPIHEQLKLQFRAELFNFFNHPNFGQPFGDLGGPQALNPQFGQSMSTLGQSLSGAQYAGSVGSGSLNPLYQLGGPRSVQFALKLTF
jgi:hypothetical protein